MTYCDVCLTAQATDKIMWTSTIRETLEPYNLCARCAAKLWSRLSAILDGVTIANVQVFINGKATDHLLAIDLDPNHLRLLYTRPTQIPENAALELMIGPQTYHISGGQVRERVITLEDILAWEYNIAIEQMEKVPWPGAE